MHFDILWFHILNFYGFEPNWIAVELQFSAQMPIAEQNECSYFVRGTRIAMWINDKVRWTSISKAYLYCIQGEFQMCDKHISPIYRHADTIHSGDEKKNSHKGTGEPRKKKNGIVKSWNNLTYREVLAFTHHRNVRIIPNTFFVVFVKLDHR